MPPRNMQMVGDSACDFDEMRQHREDEPAEFDESRGIYPQCIVWTWLPGCTQCTGGIVGHMGITTSTGQVWELLGLGASPNNGYLGFGPIIRYLPLSPRLVGKGTIDDGIARTIEKYRTLSCHPCNNCHQFVAACLDEMKYMGFPYWNCFWWLLAVMIWVMGRFTKTVSAVCCFASSILITAVVIYMFVGGGRQLSS